MKVGFSHSIIVNLSTEMKRNYMIVEIEDDLKDLYKKLSLFEEKRIGGGSDKNGVA